MHAVAVETWRISVRMCVCVYVCMYKQLKKIPLQTQRVPGGWGFQIWRQLVCESGKVVRPTQWPPLPSPLGNIPGTHFCKRLSWHQCHSAAGRIMSMKNSNDIIGNRTRVFPYMYVCMYVLTYIFIMYISTCVCYTVVLIPGYPLHSYLEIWRMSVCVCVCVCVFIHACMHACMCIIL